MKPKRHIIDILIFSACLIFGVVILGNDYLQSNQSRIIEENVSRTVAVHK